MVSLHDNFDFTTYPVPYVSKDINGFGFILLFVFGCTSVSRCFIGKERRGGGLGHFRCLQRISGQKKEGLIERNDKFVNV